MFVFDPEQMAEVKQSTSIMKLSYAFSKDALKTACNQAYNAHATASECMLTARVTQLWSGADLKKVGRVGWVAPNALTDMSFVPLFAVPADSEGVLMLVQAVLMKDLLAPVILLKQREGSEYYELDENPILMKRGMIVNLWLDLENGRGAIVSFSTGEFGVRLRQAADSPYIDQGRPAIPLCCRDTESEEIPEALMQRLQEMLQPPAPGPDAGGVPQPVPESGVIPQPGVAVVAPGQDGADVAVVPPPVVESGGQQLPPAPGSASEVVPGSDSAVTTW